MKGVVVTGEEETKAVFERLGREYPKKVVAAGLKGAGKPFRKALKTEVSPEQAKLIKTKVYTKTAHPCMYTGLFATKKPIEWFKAYWKNYGTLSNRDPKHNFRYPRKKRTKHYPHGTRKWKGGIRPRRGVERAWELSRTRVISAIDTEMKKAAIKYENKIKK